jgi:hypothetical protein
MLSYIKVEGWSQIHSLASHLIKIHFSITPSACYVPSDLLPSDFRNNIFYAFISNQISARQAYSYFLLLLSSQANNTGQANDEFTVRNLLHSPVISIPLGPNVILSTLFSLLYTF